MAFATADDVMNTVENLLKAIWNLVHPSCDTSATFPRLSYEEALAQYGSDKPDLRFEMKVRWIHSIELA